MKESGAKSKQRWLKYLTIAISLFVSHLIILVIIASRQDVALVRRDYYEAELGYQKHLESANRSLSPSKQISVKYDSDMQTVSIGKPLDHTEISATGRIHFYRPSDSALDRTLKFYLFEDANHIVDVKDYERGLWKIKVDWIVDNQSYFTESVIFLEQGDR